MLQLNLSLLISWRHFLRKKSKDENWPCGGVHLDFRICSVSKVSLFEVLESSSLIIPLHPLPITKLSYSSGTIEITSVEGYFSGEYQFKLTSTN